MCRISQPLNGTSKDRTGLTTHNRDFALLRASDCISLWGVACSDARGVENMSETLTALGGIGRFLLGMKIMTEALREAAGADLRRMLARFTSTPLRGVASGGATTAVIQSSSATTLMTVGFVGAGVMSFFTSAWRDLRRQYRHHRHRLDRLTGRLQAEAGRGRDGRLVLGKPDNAVFARTPGATRTDRVRVQPAVHRAGHDAGRHVRCSRLDHARADARNLCRGPRCNLYSKEVS